MTMPNLLPCPFCGCTTIKRVEQDDETIWHECDWCQTVGPNEGIGQAGEPQGWNHRAPTNPKQST